jgi:predicted dinucleotide-binding enzyme
MKKNLAQQIRINKTPIMNIGIIGAGEMGRCLASKLVALGHTVSIANSRGPASIKNIAANIGATATTAEEATTNKQVIIVSIPQKKYTCAKTFISKYTGRCGGY